MYVRHAVYDGLFNFFLNVTLWLCHKSTLPY
jgi:hypothetical protein